MEAILAAGARPAAADNFRPLERPTAVVAVMLTVLIVVGGYVLHGDFQRMETLRAIQQQDQKIQEYNYTRNVLVQHLAKSHDSRLGRLQSYAEQVDRKQQPGVIVYTPQAGRPVVQAVPKLELPDQAAPAAGDGETAQEWAPPPVLEGYDALRFATEELVSARLPVGIALVAALAAMAGWSAAAHRNLPALQAAPSWFRPSTVPFWWLMPVANLYLPCAIMREVWHGSDPHNLTQPTAVRLPVVGLWWMALVGSIGLFVVAVLRMATAVGIGLMLNASELMLYADAGLCIVGALTLGLVAASTWNQTRRHYLVRNFEEQLGPRGAWHRD